MVVRLRARFIYQIADQAVTPDKKPASAKYANCVLCNVENPLYKFVGHWTTDDHMKEPKQEHYDRIANELLRRAKVEHALLGPHYEHAEVSGSWQKDAGMLYPVGYLEGRDFRPYAQGLNVSGGDKAELRAFVEVKKL